MSKKINGTETVTVRIEKEDLKILDSLKGFRDDYGKPVSRADLIRKAVKLFIKQEAK